MATALINAPLNTKVTDAEKARFIEICDGIGTTPSNALRMFVSAFNRRGGFPFDPFEPLRLLDRDASSDGRCRQRAQPYRSL